MLWLSASDSRSRPARFVAVGSSAEIRARVGTETEVLDLEGGTVPPGFIDAHLHPIPVFPETPRLGWVELGPESIRTIDELVDALCEKAARTPPDAWVFGFGYQDTKLGRHPTRNDLDRVSIEQPIMIFHSSGRIGVFNSRVLTRADVARDTPDPPGDAFDRDEKGVANGVCREEAAKVVLERGPEQRVSVEEALRVFTLGSAYASFEESIKGSIEPGKLADFVVLSADLARVPLHEIKEIRVEKTFIGGRCVWKP